MVVLFLLGGALAALFLLIILFRSVQEWRMSRHNRKVALDYVKRFNEARIGWRAATPEEIARFHEQSQRKKHAR